LYCDLIVEVRSVVGRDREAQPESLRVELSSAENDAGGFHVLGPEQRGNLGWGVRLLEGPQSIRDNLAVKS